MIEYKKCFNILLIITFSLITSCTSHSNIKEFSVDRKKLFSNTLLIVEVPYKELDKEYPVETGRAVGMQHGVVGVLVSGAMEAMANSYEEYEIKNNQLYYDALGWLYTVNFKNEFAEAAERELSAIPWLTSKRCDKESEISRNKLIKRLELSNFDTMIHIYASYDFSEDCKCFEFYSKYGIYQKDTPGKAIYKSKSKFESCNDQYPDKTSLLEYWVRNNGAMIKNEMVKGINELAKAVREDIESK